MQHRVYLQLEGAVLQHTAASELKPQEAVLAEPSLEVKLWSSSAGNGGEKKDLR